MENVVDKKKSWNAYVTIAIFVLFLGAFFVASLVKKDGYFSATENRYLEQKPKLTIKTLVSGEFASKYEKYITDQFVFRNQWIQLKSVSELLLQKKDVNDVYIAKDNYLIETHIDVDVQKAYANSTRVCNFVKKEIEILGKDHVAMMVVPTAVWTLSDKLPAYATTFDQGNYIASMKDELGENFVDVRDVLQNHAGEYIYYRTDHHWTTYGAFLAYEEWARKCGVKALDMDDFTVTTVADDFLGTIHSKVNFAVQKDSIQTFEPKKMCAYEVDINMGAKKWDTLYIKDYLEQKDKYGMFLDGNNSIVTIKTDIADMGQDIYDNRNLLVIKDSYAHCFIPFLTNHYDNITILDLRYCKLPVSKIMDQYGITDVLVMYNAIHFAQESNFALLDY